MRYKAYYLGILSAAMITSLSVEAGDRGARFKQMEKAPQMAQQLHAGGAVVGAADAILGGVGATNARAAHIQALLEPGADITTAMGTLNGLLGAGGGAADAHGKVLHVQGELQPAANLTAGIGAVNALLGAGGGAADAHGKTTHIQGLLQPAANLTAGIVAVNALLGAGGGAADAHGKATHISGQIAAGAGDITAKVTATNTELGAVVGADVNAKLAALKARLDAGTNCAGAGHGKVAGNAAPLAPSADIEVALRRLGL